MKTTTPHTKHHHAHTHTHTPNISMTETTTSHKVDDIQRDEKGLAVQDLSTLNVEELHPLTPMVISRQATINIGTIGHVAHGKSTVVKAISGVKVRFTALCCVLAHRRKKERKKMT